MSCDFPLQNRGLLVTEWLSWLTCDHKINMADMHVHLKTPTLNVRYEDTYPVWGFNGQSGLTSY